MSTPMIEVDFMLLDWSDSARSGPKVVFALRDRDELAPFELATLKKGKQAGQRYTGYLVPIADDETPEPVEKQKGGPLSKLAAQWCNDTRFHAWLRLKEARLWDFFVQDEGVVAPDVAASVVREVCDVESRADLDHNDEAKRRFNELIREPYRQHLQEQGE